MKQYTGTGYTIYKHTNKVNGKVYIGLTKCKDLTRRWAGGHGYKECRYFFSAIIRYGWLNFDHEILETGLSKEEAGEKEKHYVEKYRARNPRYGYNIQSGGFCTNEFSAQGYKNAVKNLEKGTTGCPVVIFDQDGKRIKRFETMRSAAAFLGCNVSRVSSQCKRGSGTCRGYMVRYEEEVYGVSKLPDEEIYTPHEMPGTCTPVAMYDLDGEYIRSFQSVKEAAEAIGCKPQSIFSCFSSRSPQKQAKGYMWRKDVGGVHPDKIAPYWRRTSNPKNKVAVCRYDRYTGEKLATYPSYESASKACGCTFSLIYRCASGKALTGADYIWRKASEGLDKVDPCPPTRRK